MNAASTSVHNPVKKPGPVETALSAMGELAKILDEEIQIVKKPDVDAMRILLRQKNKVLIEYQNSLKAIAANPDLVKKAPVDMRSRLKSVGASLAETSEKNASALRAAAGATQRLIEYVIQVVKDEALPKNGYGDPRKMQALNSYSPTCPALAVRRTV